MINVNRQLLTAVSKGDLAEMQRLLTNGANINCVTSGGRTPLLTAVWHKQIELAKVLITKGADVNQASQSGAVSLHWMATLGNTEMVKLLLNAGADINKANSDGRTALHTASYHGHIETVAALLEAGAEIKEDKKGKTAFDFATNYPQLRGLLIAYYPKTRATLAAWELGEDNRCSDNPNSIFYTEFIQWLPQEILDDVIEFILPKASR